MIFPSEIRLSAIECSRPTGVKPKMSERKLRSGVNWQGALKGKGVKYTGVKQGWVYMESI